MSDHAIANAKGWLETITGAIAALDALNEGAESAEFDGETFTDADDVRNRIQEMPLSIMIRDGWRAPGGEAEPEEFEILLSTGGPALRLFGDLGGSFPHLQWQDWGTRWTSLATSLEEDEALRQFVGQFYLGE